MEELHRRVPDVFAAWAHRRPEAVALRTINGAEVRERTYRQVWEDVCRLRDDAFAKVPAGARMPMAMTSCADYVVGFLAALAAGVVPVPVYLPSARRPERFLARAHPILRDCSPAVVYTSADLVDVVKQDPVLGTLSVITPDSASHGPAELPRSVETDMSKDVAFLQYSSGSTGSPKGVVNTHESILRQIEFAAKVWNRDDDMHTVSWLPLYHDMGIFWGVLIPLLSGGSATLIPPHDFVVNPRIWLDSVHRYRGNWIAGPDFGYRRCVEAFDDAAVESLDLSCLQIATNGAEPIRGSTLQDFARKFGRAGLRPEVLRPQYGLAEAGLGVTGAREDRVSVQMDFDAGQLEQGLAVAIHGRRDGDVRPRGLVSCGDATFGWDVRIVDPDRRTTLSDGEVGEIWVGGAGLPQGYWRQPEQTAETFGATTAEGDGPYLRTGDAGFRYNDELYVCGRYRDLIVVGGRNHFPNDIEATVVNAGFGVIEAGACAVQPDDAVDGSWWLIVETESAAEDLADLSRILHRRILSNHETAPTRIVWVRPRALPTTTSGKIRRRESLNRLIEGRFDVVRDARLDAAASDPSVSASTATPSELAEYVASLLGLHSQDLDPGVDLTTLGLTSVLTARLLDWSASRSRRLSFADLYAEPTLRSWQQLYDEAPPTAVGDADSVTSSDTWPTTPLQRAYWLGRAAGQPLGGVGCQTYFELVGAEIDMNRLQGALDAVAQRHPMLRSEFPDSDVCRIRRDSVGVKLRFHDLSGGAHPDRDNHLAQTRRRLRGHRFDVQHGETWIVELTRLPDSCILHVAIDLIVADVTSIGTLLHDLAALYRGEDLPPVTAMSGELVATPDRLPDSVAERLPEGPQLPQVEETDIDFERHQHVLSAVAAKALDDLCRDHGVTRAAVFLTVYALVLRRWTAKDDFLVNVTTFGRSPDESDVVGDFTQTHLFCAEVPELASFAEHARTTQQGLRAALRKGQSTQLLAEQLRCGTGHSGISPVVFTYAGETPILSTRDADTLGTVGEIVSMTPQVLIDNQVVGTNGGLIASWDCRISCFPPGVVADMFEAYVELLEGLGTHDWSTPVTIGLSAHSQLIRQQRNDTATTAPRGLLYDAFRDIAANEPGRIAVRWRGDEYLAEHCADPIALGGTALSYGRLDELARRVAHAVSARHAPGSVVGIQLPKGPAQIVAVLGVMMAGCVYLPVGVDQPAERLDRICARSGMSGLIRADEATPVTGITVDEFASMLGWSPVQPVRGSEDDAAYVIYTSGSTGEPKGVVISHAAALNTVADVNRRNRVGAGDTVLALSALDFDLSVYDIFGPLSCGGQLVTVSEQTRRDAFHWKSLIAEFSVTVWNSVPALLEMLLIAAGDRPAALPSLRSVFVSGDWVPLSMPAQLRRVAPAARLIAMGGATEAAIWSNEFVVDDVDPDWISVPYGYPLSNQTFRVVDSLGNDQPDYVAGELWIGGAGVALGYHNDRELTAERFPADSSGLRWYRTGDLGCYWRDGTLQFMGRIDSQVKIRGHRVECGEIEHILRSHPLVDTAAVVPIDGCAALGAMIVRTDAAVTRDDKFADELSRYLAARLPHYMVPKTIATSIEIPLTANGKIDRASVARVVEQDIQARQMTLTVPELTAVEQQVAQVWTEVLGAEIASGEDNFFTRGGDSLRATEAISRLAERGVTGADVAWLFSNQTLGAFSAACAFGELPGESATEIPSFETEFPLTRLQQAYALGAAGVSGTTRAPTTFSIVLTPGADAGPIDLERLTHVVDGCVKELEMLRCALDTDITQRVRAGVGAAEATILDGVGDDPDALIQWMATTASDPHSVPVIRCFAAARSPRYVGLLINYLGLDARSLSTVVSTIIADYHGAPRPRQIDPTAAVFVRFVSTGQNSRLRSTHSFAAPPALPLNDRLPTPASTVTFARRSLSLDAHEADVLRRSAAQLNVTPTALVFDAFTGALHTIGGGDRFAVTVPVSHRPNYAPTDREVLGNFTRLALCEVNFTAAQPGSPEAVAAAQQQLWDAVSLDGDILDELAATRSAGGYPVVFTSTLGLTGQDPNQLTNVRTLTQTPGVWLDCQIEDEAAGMRLSWDVAVDVVDETALSVAFACFAETVGHRAGRGSQPVAAAPSQAAPLHDEWADSVTASAAQRISTEHVLPRYRALVQRWRTVAASQASLPQGDRDIERAGRRLADIVTGGASPYTLIGDPHLAPEAMLLRDERFRTELDGLTDRLFAHARALGRRLRILEVGSRTGLITERLSESVGVVLETYVYLEPDPIMAEIAAGRTYPPHFRRADTIEVLADIEFDAVLCCGSLHQLADAAGVLEAVAVSADGWLWVAENSEPTSATLISAAVLDPSLLSEESQILRTADQWWRFVTEHNWCPTQMTQEGPGLTILARRSKDARPSRTAGTGRRTAAPADTIVPARADKDTVALIAEIWQRHLGVAGASAGDDFFLLGGDSLTATKVYADLRAAGFNRIAFVDLFNYSVLGELAAHAGVPADAAQPSPIEAWGATSVVDTDHFPLTVIQRAYQAGRGDGFILGGVAAHCYFEFHIANFELSRFESAARHLVERHPGLRTTVAPGLTAGVEDDFHAVVHPVPIEPVVRERQNLRSSMSDQVIDLTERPAIDFGVEILDNGAATVGISMDNTMLDGASMMIALIELDHLYRGGSSQELPALETSFARYVWAHPELLPNADESVLPALADSRQYWRTRLSTLPRAPQLAPTSLLLDIDKPVFERAQRAVQEQDWSRIVQSCRTQGVTVASFLIANYARVLARWSQTDHFCLNVTLFDRDPRVTGIDKVIGDFTSLVLLECRIDHVVSIWDEARAVQRQLMTDLPHRSADAVWLQRELLQRHGEPMATVFPVVFTSGLGLVDMSTRPLSALGEPIFAVSQTPQTVLDLQVWENAGSLRLSWDFVTQAIPRAEAHANIDMLVDGILAVLDQPAPVVAGVSDDASHPDGPRLDSALQERVLQICAAALGRPRIEPHDNFFQLGGDSLTATKAVEQIGLEISPSATLRLLFTNPVMSDFVAKLRDESDAGTDATLEDGVL